MNKKYSSGNYFLESNFDIFSYKLNTNFSNNKLIYCINLFPFLKTNYITSSLTFIDNQLDDYKLDIYFSFELTNGIYKIYDYKNDYEEAILFETNNDYLIFKSESYILYEYINNQTTDYKLIDNKVNTNYYFLNNNYPYRIEYYDGRILTITFTNNKINLMSSNNEVIAFSYDGLYTTIISSKYYNNTEIKCSKNVLYKCNSTNYKIYNYIYEYDNIEGDYVDNLVSNIDILYSSNILTISKDIDNTYVKFYYTNNKVTKIEHNNGNIHETNLTYNSNITTVTKYEDTLKLIYDSNNMLMYSLRNNKYVKYYKYNNNFLLEYESEYVKNESIIEDDLLDYDVITYEPVDDYDDFDYSFSINQDTNQTIPSHLNYFINTNDIYHLDGYASLVYEYSLYGEEDDVLSILLFYKLLSGNIYVTLTFCGDLYTHTSITKVITSNQEFSPFIIGLKPSYSYDKVKIEVFINGEAYINTPKLSKSNMGIYYSYNSNNLVSCMNNNEGQTIITYDNDNFISNITTSKMTRSVTRDNRGNILTDSIDGFTITRTYDNYNRVLSESSNDGSISYSYSEEIINGIYYSIKTITRDGITYVIRYDNCGREIYSNENYTMNNEQVSNTSTNSYSGIRLTNMNQGLSSLSLTYNNDKLIELYDCINTTYSFVWQNNKINDIKYNTYKYIDRKTYDLRDRTNTQEFNGIYSYEYLLNPKRIKVYYNNTLKYELTFNSYDLLVNDGYNVYEYDSNDTIKKNTISNYVFKYYKNNYGYKDINSYLYNYIYHNYKYGDNELRNDPYYSNITFNDDSNITSINSSNTTILKENDKYYPLSSNLLSIDGNGPKSFTKQEYKLFYYDKDINNYATLLYGSKIIFDSTIINVGQIEFEFKLENRNLDQLIVLFKKYNHTIYLYKKSSKNNRICINYDGNEYLFNYYIIANTWYKIHIEFVNGVFDNYILIKIKEITDTGYSTYFYNNYFPINSNKILVQFGKTEQYFTPMITYGLIRNLFISNSSNNREYINIYKSDLMTINGEINKSEIRINNNVALNIGRTITSNNICPHNTSINNFEKRSINVNNNNYILDTYAYGNIIYENYIKLNNQIYYVYEYDNQRRLTREGVISGVLYYYDYTYDMTNNITSWAKLNSSNVVLKQVIYNYNNQYKMILDSIDITAGNHTTNYPITYDNITGMLPISFMGNSYSYEGYNLITYNNYNYQYNVYGRRIRKYNTSSFLDIHYYYDKNNNLIIEDRGSYRLKYLYDSSNNLYGFVYDTTVDNTFNNNIYYYIKDEIGTIYGIIDSTGNLIGKYNYNAYGLITSVDEISDSLGVTNKNPIRYRSYYYDIESEMYYLNSRYYNPLLARFITPDRFENVDKTDYKTYNLYTYCNNNPVSNIDSEGKFPIIALALLITAITATAHDVAQIATGKVSASKNENDNSIKISNSYLIFTPWMQLGYSIYLNHFKSDTKNVIIGSSQAVQYEWLGHNIAYWFYFCTNNKEKKEQAKDADIGSTIFDDKGHNLASALMKVSYGLVNTPIFIIEAFIKKINGD